MKMRDDIRRELLAALKRDFQWKRETSTWLQGGRCPQCEKREVFARADDPWVLRCGREDKCGWEQPTRERYPEIFEDCSKRAPATPDNPAASADYYLSHVRQLDLMGLRSAYSQEQYFDQQRRIGTATVRFALPGGGWWERLIDQPQRFEKKARFAFGKSYAGQWWQRPDVDLAALAAAPEIWICEGIFDALALEQAGVRAVSTMSCNNYPAAALDALRKAIADEPDATRRPTLVWAYDNGRAGERYARQFAAQARREGWTCCAALIREADEDGAKLDWNDLLIRDRLTAKDRELFRWHGKLLLAESALEKALLIRDRLQFASFHFVFRSRTFWASYDAAAALEQATSVINDRRGRKMETLEEGEEERIRAECASKALSVEEIANCAFRVLYRQRDEASDDTCYYLSVAFPSDRPTVIGGFPAGAIAAAPEFKKRLIAVGAGAIWTGTQGHFDRIMQRQMPRIADVHPLEFTGYSRDHGAYVFGDIAVKDGRVYRPNENDFFELGKVAIKLGTSERLLDIEYDPEALDLSWYGDLWAAFGPKGLVVLAFFVGAFFAEQIRREQKSFPFLEMFGQPGTGKSTLIEFLWKLCGRENYEGFDPAKATPAAMARNLGKVGNLPVVLIEGDRRDDASHARKFEWEELKTAFNGRSVRSRGVKSKGMETFEPPFRGAVVIEQNDQVNATRAVLERIISIGFDMGGFTEATKAAAERLEQWPIEKVSGFIVHVVKREAELLARFATEFARHEAALLADAAVRTNRLAKNHGQLLALLDVVRSLLPVTADQLAATRDFIFRAAGERQQTVSAEHPDVALFWERFDFIQENETDETQFTIDHSRDPKLIAVRLQEMERRCGEQRLSLPTHQELVRVMKTSRARKFVDIRSVNSSTGTGTKHCWIFERPEPRR